MKKAHINILIQDTNQFFAQGLTTLLQTEDLCKHTNVTLLTQHQRHLADLFIVTDDFSSFLNTCRTTTNTYTRRSILRIQDNHRYRTYSHRRYETGIIKRHDSINTVRQVIEAVVKKHNDSIICDAPRIRPTLTRKECQVMAALAQGLSANHIARLLGVHIKTVSHHKCSAMRKLGFSRNHELCLWLNNLDGLPHCLHDAEALPPYQKSHQGAPRGSISPHAPSATERSS
ncbi:Putative transcription factor YjjQ [Serratia fonticola]|uniref:Transcription factor YjjQ n=1 Tax=Serratia fonticola TaxID=47917 RepID=A0A0F7H7E9_SERFO|nr:LuxR C-terminal-related transcriptional regulator [Serratia fonticola]AKG68302.1 hypothetical protein WN53_03725 [Serratia fonticola]CAI1531056.1 Putative transcription factor YjjQ [Serratia fonticola]VTR51672.1 Putative transcription factor YjjQ [Serratia fonticola]